ncbi:MAG: zinc ribbon domain-containing protein [Lachnospiraceae bacterium]|nr:zinc ribbon domain-containing protein [Lachnospiraceae bacterium]
MSYCVNCGVELDETAKTCPLCNTPVINPKAIKNDKAIAPFPKEKAQVEEIQRADFGWLVSMVCLATAVTCGVLNWLVFKQNLWSLAVIGACVVLWVMLVPAVIYHKWSPYFYLLMDGGAVMLYLYLIARMTESYHWFYHLGVPMTAFTIVVVELLTLAFRKFPRGILTRGLYLFVALGVLCVGYEIIIDLFRNLPVRLGWSAVVLTICIIVGIAIITTLSRRRLRNELRRRLHF